MSDERHISELISDNEQIYIELRNVVAQLKICVDALKIIEGSTIDLQTADQARGVLEKVDKKYR